MSRQRRQRTGSPFNRGARPLGADPAFAQGRAVDDADHRAAPVQQRDQTAEQRAPGDEGLGAVDGIENPDIFGVVALHAVFLAEDAVFRHRLGQDGPHRRLGAPIGDRDRAGIGLGVDGDGGAEMAHHHLTGGIRQALGQGQEACRFRDHGSAHRRIAQRAQVRDHRGAILDLVSTRRSHLRARHEILPACAGNGRDPHRSNPRPWRPWPRSTKSPARGPSAVRRCSTDRGPTRCPAPFSLVWQARHFLNTTWPASTLADASRVVTGNLRLGGLGGFRRHRRGGRVARGRLRFGNRAPGNRRSCCRPTGPRRRSAATRRFFAATRNPSTNPLRSPRGGPIATIASRAPRVQSSACFHAVNALFTDSSWRVYGEACTDRQPHRDDSRPHGVDAPAGKAPGRHSRRADDRSCVAARDGSQHRPGGRRLRGPGHRRGDRGGRRTGRSDPAPITRRARTACTRP